MERDKKFPFGRLIWAAVVGGATTAGSVLPSGILEFFYIGIFCPIIFFLGTCIYCVFKR